MINLYLITIKKNKKKSYFEYRYINLDNLNDTNIKNHIKNKSPDNYDDLKETINYIFKNKIKDEHIKNYFNYLFIQANDFINKNS